MFGGGGEGNNERGISYSDLKILSFRSQMECQVGSLMYDARV